MTDALNVAAYLLSKIGYVSTMKLQKLVYYSHAYHLVAKHEPLIPNHFEAWVNGPVLPELFNVHRKKYVISRADLPRTASEGSLSRSQQQTCDHVLSAIGNCTGQELSQLTHAEAPWINARNGAAPQERSHNRITDRAIVDYYSAPNDNPVFAQS